MLALAGDADTVMNAVALTHAFVPAVAGAVVVTVFELTTTSAVSCRPILSVTVSRTVYDPELGATTVAVSVLLPVIEVEPLTTVHA
jgi:hypothetical protein